MVTSVQSGAGHGWHTRRRVRSRPLSARLRAAQIVATALGWRIFEDYLIEAGELREVPTRDAEGRTGPLGPSPRGDAMAVSAGPSVSRTDASRHVGPSALVGPSPDGRECCNRDTFLTTRSPGTPGPLPEEMRHVRSSQAVNNRALPGTRCTSPTARWCRPTTSTRSSAGAVRSSRRSGSSTPTSVPPREQLLPALHPQSRQPFPLRRPLPLINVNADIRRSGSGATEVWEGGACWSGPGTHLHHAELGARRSASPRA